jgi:hypothetical protein
LYILFSVLSFVSLSPPFIITNILNLASSSPFLLVIMLSESIQSLGDRLLSSNLIVQLDARRELDALVASSHSVAENVLPHLLQEVEKLSTPKELWTELSNSIARLLVASTVPCSESGPVDAAPLLCPVVIRFLCMALNDEDTSAGSAAANALIELILCAKQTTSSWLTLVSALAVHLRRSASLLRLFDQQQIVGSSASPKGMPMETVCEALRSVPLHNCTDDEESTRSVLLLNVLDHFVLDELVLDAIREGDILMVMNTLYAAGWILRTSIGSRANIVGIKILRLLTLAVVGSVGELEGNADNLDAFAPMASMLRPFALRAAVILLDGCSVGVEIAQTYHWLPAVLAMALSYRDTASGGNCEIGDVAASWDVLSALCTSAAGLLALVELEDGAHHLISPVELGDNSAVTPRPFQLCDGVLLSASERIVSRGDEALRVALLRFISCVVQGSSTEKCPVFIAVSKSLFRCIWTLRNNAEPHIRAALWQCVRACLGAALAAPSPLFECAPVVEMRTVIAASSASQLTSMEDEPSADVRSEMLKVAHLALREASTALFHDRLRSLVKAGVWPARVSAAMDVEVPR